ncbi:VOC family protein [Methylomonas rhizoryzae]|uniref:VOC family protein n=1 Tax=Methylomonas rhizoryzae TaxID=2608981 RepID=UPI001231ADE0|nr:VOC family protein [Methylomonas rhizoryzae]
MSRSRIDHLVVTAPTLEAGADYLRNLLGVEPVPGGTHPRMGTHNRLLKLGESCYLEVIAVDPAAARPNRSRWFELDAFGLTPPCLRAWVANTDSIEAACAASSLSLGLIEPMCRGELEWLISIPANGDLVMQGVAPQLIQWPADRHPAAKLADSGCKLVGLEGFHPQAKQIEQCLANIGFDDCFSVSLPPPGMSPHLAATIQTPAGLRRIGGASGFRL